MEIRDRDRDRDWGLEIEDRDWFVWVVGHGGVILFWVCGRCLAVEAASRVGPSGSDGFFLDLGLAVRRDRLAMLRSCGIQRCE